MAHDRDPVGINEGSGSAQRADGPALAGSTVVEAKAEFGRKFAKIGGIPFRT